MVAHILIVDDDRTTRFRLRSILESDGYTVSEATNGAEALFLIRTLPIQLVITDMNMPIMNGTELLVCVQQEAPEMKVIVISGACESTESLGFLPTVKMLGAFAAIPKPLSASAVRAAVMTALQTDPQVESAQ